MEFSFTEEQELLRKTARDVLQREAPTSLVREMEEDAQGYSPELWRTMAGLGWLGLPLPEAHGGAGGSCRMRQPSESTQCLPADHTIHNGPHGIR